MRRLGAWDFLRFSRPSLGRKEKKPEYLYKKESDKTKGHEGSWPYQIEVEPGVTEDRKAKFSRDSSCDHPCQATIGAYGHRVAVIQENGGGAGRHVMADPFRPWCFDSGG